MIYPTGSSPFSDALDGNLNSGLGKLVSNDGSPFVGDFEMPCSNKGDRDTIWKNQYYDHVRHDLVADEYTSKNNTCELLYRTIRQMGTYQDVGASETSDGARKLNFGNPKVKITPWTLSAVADHNARGECGVKDWVI